MARKKAKAAAKKGPAKKSASKAKVKKAKSSKKKMMMKAAPKKKAAAIKKASAKKKSAKTKMKKGMKPFEAVLKAKNNKKASPIPKDLRITHQPGEPPQPESNTKDIPPDNEWELKEAARHTSEGGARHH